MLDKGDAKQPTQGETQPQVWLGNRAQRRQNRDPEAQKRSAIIGDFNRMEVLTNETTNEWNQVIADNERNLTRIVYEGRLFIFRFLDTRHQLPGFLERAHFVNLESPFIEPKTLGQFDSQDIFSQRIRMRVFGLFPIEAPSLSDIEQMPLLRTEDGATLTKDDIKWINLIFHDDIFNPETNQKSIIRESILYLANQKLARPEEKITIPVSLRPLHDRVVAFFDYYKNLLTNFDLDSWEESRLIKTLNWGRPFLPQALGIFMPARLGITPQSTIKLLQARAEFSFAPTFIWKQRILKYIDAGVQDAYRVNGLPKNLAKYQHLDIQNDQTASEILWEYYQSLDLSGDNLQDINNREAEWLDKLTKLYFKHLKQDISINPQKSIEVGLVEHPIFKNVVVTSQYPNTLIFILRFRDGKTHLTLEIDKDQLIYGLPARLIKDNPHFMSLILKDLLPPVLDWAKEHHPSAEPIKLSDYRKSEPAEAQIQEQEKLHYNPDDYSEYRLKKPKYSKILTPLARFLEGPEPANVIQLHFPKFVVFHNRDQVQEMLGKKAPERDIDLVMRAIGEFEYGRGDFKKLKEDIIEGEDLWEIRVKGIGPRILVAHTEGGFFTLAKGGYRREIFNIRRRGN